MYSWLLGGQSEVPKGSLMPSNYCLNIPDHWHTIKDAIFLIFFQSVQFCTIPFNKQKQCHISWAKASLTWPWHSFSVVYVGFLLCIYMKFKSIALLRATLSHSWNNRVVQWPILTSKHRRFDVRSKIQGAKICYHC